MYENWKLMLFSFSLFHFLSTLFSAPAFDRLHVSPRQGGVSLDAVTLEVTLTSNSSDPSSVAYDSSYFNGPVSVIPPGENETIPCFGFVWTTTKTFQCTFTPDTEGNWIFQANMKNGYNLIGPNKFTTVYTVRQ